MFGAKKKTIGGIEYKVVGSTIEYAGRHIARKSYSTTKGKVIVERGTVTHPDGSKTAE